MKLPWKKGPTAPYLDKTLRRYRVTYRTRADEWTPWTANAIEMVVHGPGEARARVIGFISKKHRIQVEVMRVQEIAAEAPIQTGRKVELVSEYDYETRMREAKEKTEYERKEILREKGLIIP